MFSRVDHTVNSSSRKRRRVSRDLESASPPIETNPRRAERAHTTMANSSRHRDEETAVRAHDATIYQAQLRQLESELHSMRNLITCKICQRYLTEPYNLACGHTYCYICLDSWLVTQHKRTCPECRAHVWQEPVPSYIVKEMVMLFNTRQQLFGDGETLEEHASSAREAADKVSVDRGGSGIFKGLFVKMLSAAGRPWRDEEDGVDRCAFCGHEIVENYCSNVACQHAYESSGDDDSYDEDAVIDAFGEAVDHDSDGGGLSLDESDNSEDDEEDEDDSEMGSFIDDEGATSPHAPGSDGIDAWERSVLAAAQPVARRFGRPIIIHDSDDDQSEAGAQSDNSDGSRSTATRQNDRMSATHARTNTRSKRRGDARTSRARPQVISDEESDGGDEEGTGSSGTSGTNDTTDESDEEDSEVLTSPPARRTRSGRTRQHPRRRADRNGSLYNHGLTTSDRLDLAEALSTSDRDAFEEAEAYLAGSMASTPNYDGYSTTESH